LDFLSAKVSNIYLHQSLKILLLQVLIASRNAAVSLYLELPFTYQEDPKFRKDDKLVVYFVILKRDIGSIVEKAHSFSTGPWFPLVFAATV
jgi:hypothetical protein